MLKPNYKNSTLNLMSSIASIYDHKINYQPLKSLSIENLKQSTNVVLMIIDGLGYEFLRQYGKGTEFNKHLKGKITTVFPSSTSAAMTSMYTGLSPQEHGMTAWHMFMKEFGDIIVPLPYVGRFSRNNIVEQLGITNLFNLPSFLDKIKVKHYLVQGKDITDSHFTKTVAGRKTTRIGYKNTKDYFKQIRKIILSKGKKFIFAYYGKHDALCHDNGIRSRKVQEHFKQLNRELVRFKESIKNTNTTLIITADHGHMDVEESKIIHVEDHPLLEECLTLPLCGEFRFAYAYVKPSKEKQFVNYIKTKLKYCCDIYKSESLLKRGYFGQGKMYKNFEHRIGDYTLLMKDHYGIYHWPLYIKHAYRNIGDHGGLSKEELFVPLIVIKS